MKLIGLTFATLLIFLQTKDATKCKFLSELVNERNKPFQEVSDSAIYLISTERECVHCYSKIARIELKKYPGYPLRIVLLRQNTHWETVTDWHIFTTRSRAMDYKKEMDTLKVEVLFYLKDRLTDFPKEMDQQPSPQVVVKQGTNFTYLDYAEVVKLMKEN